MPHDAEPPAGIDKSVLTLSEPTACETAYWPAGTFENAFWANRRSVIESIIDADPVALCVRELMAERSTWAGTATDFLQASTDVLGQAMPGQGAASVGWPKNPRALAGRLRRAQTFLRALGIEISFSRDGRAGTRLIRITAGSSGPCLSGPGCTVRTVSSIRRDRAYAIRTMGRSLDTGAWLPTDDADGADGKKTGTAT